MTGPAEKVAGLKFQCAENDAACALFANFVEAANAEEDVSPCVKTSQYGGYTRTAECEETNPANCGGISWTTSTLEGKDSYVAVSATMKLACRDYFTIQALMREPAKEGEKPIFKFKLFDGSNGELRGWAEAAAGESGRLVVSKWLSSNYSAEDAAEKIKLALFAAVGYRGELAVSAPSH